VLTITVSGPYAFKDTPVVASYKVTATNASTAPASNITLSHALTLTDGAYLIAAQSSQGSCDQGGPGITALNCAIGSLDTGASVTVDVEAQMISGDITFASSATGIDGNGAGFSTAPVSEPPCTEIRRWEHQWFPFRFPPIPHQKTWWAAVLERSFGLYRIQPE
jgi:hypothetical protein